MPTGATTVGHGRQPAQGQQPVLPIVPFIRASALHREPTGIDITRQLSTSDQDLGVFDIPAYGYVRNLVILVQASGGTGGAPSITNTEDSPFCILKNIALTEPNGAQLSSFNSGIDVYFANKFGGYRSSQAADPKASPIYSPFGTNGAAATFCYRIPVEINSRDGLGSLPNQNAAATFKLRLTLAKVADVMTGTLPTTLPNVRVRVFLEAWDQPEPTMAGQTNQTQPPAMNTTQFWSSNIVNVNAGQQTVRLTRVGNYIRNIVTVFRATSDGTRATGEPQLPDPWTLQLDTRPLDIVEKNNWLNQMWERGGYGGVRGNGTTANETPNGLNNGVRVYDFTSDFDGSYGRENRDLWLPTLGSTRLELSGSFGVAGTLTILTNDVAVAGNVFL